MDNYYKQIYLPINFAESLTYKINQFEPKYGDLVWVNYRGKSLVGMVGEDTNQQILSKLDLIKVKEIEAQLPFQLETNFIKFIQFVASYNIINLGELIPLFTRYFDEDLFNNFIGKKEKIISNLFQLNSEQQQAYEKIKAENGTFLLEGVTGSGKTEIYFHLIDDAINNGQQVLLLMPEIMLTNQIIERFEQSFNTKPLIWHSSITAKQKRKNFTILVRNEAQIIIGTRSALFLPYPNLSMIIVDEEHDHSYKQSEQLIYHARDMAVARGHYCGFKVVLGSATPSLESLLNVRKNKYKYITLTSKYANQQQLAVEVVDLKQNKPEKNFFVSDKIKEAVKQNWLQKKQSLLFLNRRGYAPLLLCGKCSNRIICKNCNSWMVVHKKLSYIKCHHCGCGNKISYDCFNCGAQDSMIACGPGVERVYEEMHNFLPEAKIIIIDSDNVTNVKQMNQLIKQISNNEVDIIIGTQMISKGFDFKELTLVAIIDADLGMAGDLRMVEKNYQIIEQVLGRAGRHQAGRALIQTYNINNELIKAICEQDYGKFIEKEINLRQQYAFPPFTQMISILFSSLNENKLENFCTNIMHIAYKTKGNEQVNFLGPAPAMMYKVKNRFRMRINLIAPNNFNLQKFVKVWLQNIKKDVTIRIKVDVNPYNFL